MIIEDRGNVFEVNINSPAGFGMVEHLVELSQHMDFIPTIKDSYTNGKNVVYTIDKFDYIDPREHLETLTDKNNMINLINDWKDDFPSLVLLHDTIFFHWKSKIKEYFNEKGFACDTGDFFKNTVVGTDGQLWLVCPHHMKISNDHKSVNVLISSILSRRSEDAELVKYLLEILAIQNIGVDYEIKLQDLQRLRTYAEQKIKTKEMLLQNMMKTSISKEKVKEVIGQDLYSEYFGDSDG